MTIFDESGSWERVECPFCHADTDESCDHLLAFADVTFNEEPCGPIGDYLAEFQNRIIAAFSEKLASGSKPKWGSYYVQEVWDALQEDGVANPENFSLPSRPFYDLVLELLGTADGIEHPGKLIVGSGGRCESAVRLMYAENPKKVIEDALKLLSSQLVEEKPKSSRRKRR